MCLCLVLVLFARFQPGTRVIRSWALSVLVLSIGFFVSGIGSALPVWATVIGTNVILLSSGAIIYSGFLAFFEDRTVTLDRWGWAMVALTVPAFWYWGLIEPNGTYRSMVFSLATAAINSRTALMLGRSALQRGSDIPAWVMAALFSVLTVWMTARFGVLLLSEPAPPALRGANPTSWMTVLGFIILMSLMSVCVMWMEANRLKERRADVAQNAGRLSGFVDYFRNKLLLLWSAVIVLIIVVTSALGIGYLNLRDAEKVRHTRNVKHLNDAFVEQTSQVVNQADTLLRAVRGFYQKTGSLPETESFIMALGFNRNIIDNIYLITSDGRIVISHDQAAKGRTVTDRDYFKTLANATDDQLFIAAVEEGRVTGKPHFRITRRLNNRDGSFGGLVLATVNPEAFSRHYSELTEGTQYVASLMGITDRKLRARSPAPPVERWSVPVESPIWEMLKQAPSGQYENISQVDNIRRLFVYVQVGQLPLVMVTGFSEGDLQQGIRMRMIWLVGTTLTFLLFTLMLALLLTVEGKRRDDQKQAEDALRKKEQLLNEAQAIGKIGNWELDLLTGAVIFSDQIYEISGRTQENMPRTIAETLLTYHPDDIPEVERALRKIIENTIEVQLDARHIAPDGSIKWFRLSGKPHSDSNGNVVKVHGTTQDIGKDKRMELELKSLNENLLQRVEEETSRRIASEGLLTHHAKMAAMGEMIGAIAHQWRQPLSTVSVIFQNLLAARRLNRLDEAYLEKAATDATALISHMSSTIDSFRNFFRPDKTKERFNALDKIYDATDFIRAQLKSNGITLLLPEQGGADCMINGFANEFVQVILNLLANARDAILDKRLVAPDDDDSITITVQPEESQIIIEITDTGCGIPEQSAPRIFEPYFTTKVEGQGTGIGLYMSRQIIEESMGGKLTFTSRQGETIFRIEVPYV